MTTYTLAVEHFAFPRPVAFLGLFTMITLALIWAHLRVQRVTNFQTNLKIDFLAKVLSDDTLCDTGVEVHKKVFFDRLPSIARLFFSRRPLHRGHWFTMPEIDFFFHPNKITNHAA